MEPFAWIGVAAALAIICWAAGTVGSVARTAWRQHNYIDATLALIAVVAVTANAAYIINLARTF